MLAAVHEPRTTDQVAQLISAATSTVSEHLNALAGDGLVTRQRAGRHIYYELSDRGRRLLELLSDGET